MRVPFDTEPEIRAAAEQEVTNIMERVAASNASGGLKQVNRQYKSYRQGQLAKAEKAVPYAVFIEPFLATVLRQAAMSGRTVG